jgi:hypothetical protein
VIGVSVVAPVVNVMSAGPLDRGRSPTLGVILLPLVVIVLLRIHYTTSFHVTSIDVTL